MFSLFCCSQRKQSLHVGELIRGLVDLTHMLLLALQVNVTYADTVTCEQWIN